MLRLLVVLAALNFSFAGVNTYLAVAGQSALNAGLAVLNFGMGILASLFAARR